MAKMTNEQRRTLYGMATQLGIYEKGNPSDDLHALVHGLTGKESISELTVSEAGTVISELISLKDGQNLPRIKKPVANSRPGMITADQVKKVWYFMYRLAELDAEPSKATLSKRLCGIIQKNLPVSAFEKDPFRFVTFDQGGILIEVIKKLVQNEKSKRRVKNA